MPIAWRLTNPQAPSFPGVTNRSRPLPTGDPPGVNRALGSALAAGFSALAQIANEQSVEYRINSELDLIARDSEHLLDKGTGSGLLAVVKTTKMKQPAGPDIQSFLSAFLAGVESDPQIAIKKYLETPSLEQAAAKGASVIKRFYWGVRN
jgi:hypothetical protein